MSNLSTIILSDFIGYITSPEEGSWGGLSQEEWKDVLVHYSSIMEAPNFVEYINKMKFCVTMISRFNIAESLIKNLEVSYDKNMAEKLKRLGFPGQYNPELKERYLKELQAAYSKAKVFLAHAKQKEEEILNAGKRRAQEKPPTKEDFYESIVAASKHQNYRVDPKETTVLEYCLIIKSMKHYAKDNTRDSR